jgi:hypothetical protein
MGLHNEYGSDVFMYEDAREDEEFEEQDFELDEETWQDWYSEHILNMWMSLRQYIEDNSLQSTLLNRASYPDFVQFVQAVSRVSIPHRRQQIFRSE